MVWFVWTNWKRITSGRRREMKGEGRRGEERSRMLWNVSGHKRQKRIDCPSWAVPLAQDKAHDSRVNTALEQETGHVAVAPSRSFGRYKEERSGTAGARQLANTCQTMYYVSLIRLFVCCIFSNWKLNAPLACLPANQRKVKLLHLLNSVRNLHQILINFCQIQLNFA